MDRHGGPLFSSDDLMQTAEVVGGGARHGIQSPRILRLRLTEPGPTGV
jgi:hypothetical protein